MAANMANDKRRAGRPRIERADPLHRTTIMLPESLLGEIAANLGETSGEQSRNQWLIRAARAYLDRAEDAATREDWQELRDYVREEQQTASRRARAATRAVEVAERELDRVQPVAATLSPEQREYCKAAADYESAVGEQGRYVVLSGNLQAILARMSEMQQWSDAAVHPAAHQE